VPGKDREPQSRPLAKYLRYSHLGVEFFLSVAIFTGIGIWLDRRLGTVVLFTLLGLALGFAGGLVALYRELFPGKEVSRKKPAAGETKTTPGSPRKSGGREPDQP
jgi:F0F1-type ATP synthase assembly protein I